MKKKPDQGANTRKRSQGDSVESEQDMVAPMHSRGALDEPDGHHPFPVVGVGASAGGLEAFRQLLSSLPAESGMAFVQMHGGEIEAHSEGVNRGSEFIVRIPLSSESVALTDDVDALPRAPGGAGDRKRILVVDDNEDQAQSLGMLMRVLGHETRLAFDGPSAVEAATSFVPDIALIDIGIPGINGYEVARRIKELPQLQNVVLVAQTGWGHDDDRARSRDAGFDYHLVKPLNLAELREIVAATGAVSDGSSGGPVRGKTIRSKVAPNR